MMNFRLKISFNIYHETVFVKQFSMDTKALKGFVLITFLIMVAIISHVARGKISLFEFQKQNNVWKLDRGNTLLLVMEQKPNGTAVV
jgi:hypothetical protein